MDDEVIATQKLEMDTLDLMDFLNKYIGENHKIVNCPIFSESGENFTVVTLKRDEDGEYSLELS
jgi:hypothetical protein